MNFIGKEQLEKWGQEAARDFLTKHEPLNSSIEKIAHEYSLNAEQIKRVCENANISTNLSLFKEAEDKRFEFEQACHQTILGELDGPTLKQASAAPDVSAPDEYDFPLNVRFGLYQAEESPSEDDAEKTAFEMDANELADHPEDLLSMLEAKQEAARELEAERDKVASMLEGCRDNLVDRFKQAVLDGEASFSKIAAAGLSLFKEDPYIQNAAKEELVKIGFELHQQGAVEKEELTKLAYAVPGQWIADHFDMPGTPVLIQNGRQTSWYVLDTLVRQRDRPADYDKPLLLLHDDIKYIKKRMATGEDLDHR